MALSGCALSVCVCELTIELKQMSVVLPQRGPVRHGQHGGRCAHGLVHAALHVDAHGRRALVKNGKVRLRKRKTDKEGGEINSTGVRKRKTDKEKKEIQQETV